MRIIFVNRFYWPDEPATAQLLTDLAERLAAAGNDVTVISSRPSGAPTGEVRNGVGIHRVVRARGAQRGIVGKGLDYGLFYAAALWSLLIRARRGAVVVALTDPPLLGIGAWLIARARGAHLVHWVQDVYPEIAVTLSGQRWLGLFRGPRNVAWRRADACVAVGADMAALLQRAGVPRGKVHVIHNPAPAGVRPWEEPGPPPLRTEWQLTGRFVAAYSGNLGRVHDLEPVLEVAARLRDERRIVFLFIGGGPQRARLEASARERSLSNVQFRPAQPRSRLGETLAVADIHLVTLRAGCEDLVFPSKFHGVVAAGRPVLFVGPRHAEPARLVRAHELGFAFERGETAGIAATLRRLAGDAAERARLAHQVEAFSRAAPEGDPAAQWSAICANVAGCNPRAGEPLERLAQ